MNKLVSLQSIDNSLQVEKFDKTPARSQPEISLIFTETSPQNKTPLHSKLNLIPAFPQFHRGSVRKSILVQKTPKNDAPLGLFPIEHSNSNPKEFLKKGSFARIGMPTIVVVPSGEKNASNRAKEIPSMRSIGKSYTFKDLATAESKVLSGDGDTPKNLKTFDLESVETSKVHILMKKLRSGRTSLQHLSDHDLMDLAVEILKKPPDNRTSMEIAILVKCVAPVEFFKKQDYKTTENCLKAMHLVSKKAGDAVFSIGDTGTTFWVIIKGSVAVWLNVDQVVGENEKGENIVEKVFKEVRILHPGSAFGEMALVDKKPRAASIICKEDCEFAVLEQIPFKEIMREATEKKLFEEVNFLAALPLFKTWEFDAIKRLFSFAPIVAYRRGNVIYDEGDQPEKMYVVKKGTFKVLKEVEIEDSHRGHYNEEMSQFRRNQVKKKTVQLGILGEKEIFGEEELLDGARRKHKIACESLEGQVYEISSKEFESMVMENEHTANWLEDHMKAKKKYYEKRFKTIKETTEQHKHLLFFPKSPVHAGSYGRKQHNVKKSPVNNLKIHQNSEERASISYYPEGKFTIKQTFLGENPKYLNAAILEESVEKYRGSTANNTQKAKGRTCPNSPPRETSQHKEQQQSPLKLGLLQLAIHELNIKKKTTSTSCSPKNFEVIKLINKRMDARKTTFFQDSQNETAWGDGSLENLEERRVSPKKGPPEIQSPQEVGGSYNAVSLVMHPKAKSLSKERERSQESKNAERLKIFGVQDLHGRFPIVRQNYSNDEGSKLTKIGSPTSAEGGGNDWYESPNISTHVSPKHASPSNSMSAKIMKELEALKTKAVPKISWEGQRQKWREIMQEKAGKSYKRMFYSRDETFELKSGEQTEIIKIDQQEGNSSIVVEKSKEPVGRENKDGNESQQRNTRKLQTAAEGLRRIVTSRSLAFSVRSKKMK